MKKNKRKSDFRWRKEVTLLPSYIIGIIWAFFTIFMIGWIIAASLSSTKEVFTGNVLSTGLHFENYTKAFFRNKALMNLLNSVIYTVPSCILTIIVSAPAAYCLTRFKFKFNGLIKKSIITALGIPGIMIVMPLFSIVSTLKLSGTHLTLIFIYTATSVPYTTFFLMAFFQGISDVYEEAAAIDGCGPIQCFWRIMFPLAQPAIMTVTIFNFISRWNEYFMALIFAGSTENMSLSVALYQLIVAMTREGGWSGMFAAVTFVSAPTIIIYILLSKRLIGGATAGGLKG